MEWIEKIISLSDPSDREIGFLDKRPFTMITVVAQADGSVHVADGCHLSGLIVEMINSSRGMASDCWIVYGSYEGQPDGSIEIDDSMYMDRGYAYLSNYDHSLHASRRMRVQRMAWIEAYGEPGIGKNIVGKCGQKNCIRPKHLGESLGHGSVWERLSTRNRRPSMLSSAIPQAEDELRALIGPHLYWSGTMSHGVGRVNRRKQTWSVRRYLYCCCHGRVPRAGYGGVSPFCGESDCVSPFHVDAIMRGGGPIEDRTLKKTCRYKYLSYSESERKMTHDDLLSRLKGPMQIMGVQGIREAIELGQAERIDPAWGIMLK